MLFQRAREHGIYFVLADLRPCPFNLFGRSGSWFDVFAEGESQAVKEAWLEEAERGLEGKDRRRYDLIDRALHGRLPVAKDIMFELVKGVVAVHDGRRYKAVLHFQKLDKLLGQYDRHLRRTRARVRKN